MYIKTTPHAITFLVLVGNFHAPFDAPIHWNILDFISTFKSLKVICSNQTINYLRASPIAIASNAIISGNSSRTIRASNRMTAFKMDFATYNHYIF
jgi:hypothetical protein